MARLIEPKCRICRRAGMKLLLKGEKCLGMKCILDKRKFPPGVRSRRGVRITNYLLQIREKQKLKKMYGLFEKQFRRFFQIAEKKKGPTGDNLLLLLERRLDNLIFRTCFASSRQQARQLVRHGHVRVNNRKVNIPSYLAKEGDIVTIKERSQKLYPVLKSMSRLENEVLPEWFAVDGENYKITINRVPDIKDITIPINLQLIIELYSKV
ncbi:MAG: 30S ribosomal protein S4 [Spirochaetes bacterium]|nr:30S ribosomal protein S4 [Spirochaetota bacterium]